MARTGSMLLGGLGLLGAACGGSDDGGCPSGFVDFYGTCVPEVDGGDTAGETETPLDGRDGGPDADAESAWETDGPREADAPRDDAGCVPSGSEICNGIDDDCDTRTDDGFACAAGAPVGCRTACGTEGAATCRADCTVPPATDCTPPDEVCNGIDDDCDGVCDDGFGCCAGTDSSCTTWCGSTGSVHCSEGCLMPGTCTPPDEVCGNGRDDDCDGAIDEGCGGSHDTCAAPLDVSAGGTFTGTTAGMVHDAFPPRSCVPGDRDPPNAAPDAFFFFDLTAPSDVFINTAGSWIDTVLYVGATCGGGELGCNDDIDPPGGTGSTAYLDSAVALRNLAPGRTYITLDAYSDGEAGEYTLTVYITPTDTAGDRCGSPTQILPGTTTLSGNTCGFSGEYAGSCGGTGNEEVYFFTVGEAHTVSLSSCNAGTGYGSVLHLRSDCISATDEVACAGPDPTCGAAIGGARVSRSLEPGIYYLFVDGTGTGIGACGSYELSFTGI